jgi:hypothetical protein
MLLKSSQRGRRRWCGPVLRGGGMEEFPALAASQGNHLAPLEIIRIQLPCFHIDPLTCFH